MTLWTLSCALNLMLGGSPREPLCSRVYRMPEGTLRNLYITNVDAFFSRTRGDWLHCLHTHAAFLDRNLERRLPTWRNTSPR